MSAVRSLHARVAVLLMLVLGSVGACFAVAGWYYAWVTAGSAHDTLLRYGASQIAENTYQLGVRVAMIRRPALPPGLHPIGVAGALDWAATLSGR